MPLASLSLPSYPGLNVVRKTQSASVQKSSLPAGGRRKKSGKQNVNVKSKAIPPKSILKKDTRLKKVIGDPPKRKPLKKSVSSRMPITVKKVSKKISLLQDASTQTNLLLADRDVSLSSAKYVEHSVAKLKGALTNRSHSSSLCPIHSKVKHQTMKQGAVLRPFNTSIFRLGSKSPMNVPSEPLDVWCLPVLQTGRQPGLPNRMPKMKPHPEAGPAEPVEHNRKLLKNQLISPRADWPTESHRVHGKSAKKSKNEEERLKNYIRKAQKKVDEIRSKISSLSTTVKTCRKVANPWKPSQVEYLEKIVDELITEFRASTKKKSELGSIISLASPKDQVYFCHTSSTVDQPLPDELMKEDATEVKEMEKTELRLGGSYESLMSHELKSTSSRPQIPDPNPYADNVERRNEGTRSSSKSSSPDSKVSSLTVLKNELSKFFNNIKIETEKLIEEAQTHHEALMEFSEKNSTVSYFSSSLESFS